MPRGAPAGDWAEAVNDKALDETRAHMNMFEPTENPGYETLTNDAAARIERWFQNDWYAASDDPDPQPVEEVS
ncbi:hypothetical protein CDD83_2333 [Cordyceps sp. RAO-2017]|nr:hypothetical protein CDD83_2333 [Cordyceps sp. RAO-2017]